MRLNFLFFVLLSPAPAASALLESRAQGSLALKDRGQIRLFDFRPDSATGWKIRKATLFLHLESGEPPRQIAVSSIAVKWTEDAPQQALEGIFGKAASRHGSFRVTPIEKGWLSVELEPWLIEWLAAGKSFGLALEQGPRRFHGRGPAYYAPYLLVEGDPP